MQLSYLSEISGGSIIFAGCVESSRNSPSTKIAGHTLGRSRSGLVVLDFLRSEAAEMRNLMVL